MAQKFHPRAPWGPGDRKLSKEALVLADYCSRCPTRTSEGLFSLNLGYIEVDLPLDTAEIVAAFDELSAAKLLDYDAKNEVVLDRTALRLNPLRHPRDKQGERVVFSDGPHKGELKIDKRIPNALRIFESVPESPLKIEFVAMADLYSPDLADAIREASKYAYPSPLEAPSEDHARTIEGPSKSLSQRRAVTRGIGDEDSRSDIDAVDLVKQSLNAEVVGDAS